MKKNIWIFNHFAEPPEYETRVRNNKMAHFLQLQGYNVTIFSASTIHNTKINLIKNGEKYIKKEYDDLKFVHINCPNYEGNGLKRKINMVVFPWKLYKYTKNFNEKPDVIINDLTVMAFDFPFKIARRYKCPIITEIRDLWPESIIAYGLLKKKSLLAKLLYRVEKNAYIKSDSIVFSMEGGKDYIVEKGWNKNVELEKIFQINNGVDLEEFEYNKAHYKIDDTDLENNCIFKVIYVGSIRKANNIEMLINAAKILQNNQKNNIKILIYGDGNEREMLMQQCKNEGIENIIFKGQIDKKFIPYVLSKGNLNLMHGASPEISKYGLSLNKSFDYLASGRPILSDIDTKYDYIIKNNAGIKVSCDPNSICQGVLYFYNLDEKSYENYCKNARQTALCYDYKKLTDRLIYIIENKVDL